MNKFLTILIGLFFASFSAMSQDYKPMLEEGKSWDFYFSAYNGEIGIVPYKGGNRTYIVGDTIIEGVQWYKFAGRYMITQDVVFYPPFVLSDEYIHRNQFMREDIANQQVFGLFKNLETGESKELLLYDFTVNEGDTIDLWDYGYGGMESFVAKPHYCANITEVSLGDGFIVKLFEYHNIEEPGITDWFGPVVIIEGIGASAFWHPAYASYDALDCVKVGETILMSGLYGCNAIISSIPDYISEKNILYPNPSNGIVQFPATIQFDKIKVYNTMGQTIEDYQIYTNNGKTFIEWDSELQAGVYYVVFYKDGAMHSEKMVLQN